MVGRILGGLFDSLLNVAPGMFIGNCPFVPEFPIFLSITFYSRIWCFFLISTVMSPFSFPILLIWILSLCPLVSLAKGLSILLIFLKEPAPGFVDCSYSSFCFYLVDFSPECAFSYLLWVPSTLVVHIQRCKTLIHIK